MDVTVIAQYLFDHAGIGETSLMTALTPETADPSRLKENTAWYTETANDALAALGEPGTRLILARMRELLGSRVT